MASASSTIQNTIPLSSVSIYNAGGFVASSTSNAQGFALVPFPCAQAPIVSVLSLTATGTFCNIVNISNPITLPVKFSSFTSKLVPQGVLLSWSTAYELNNEKYVVEKSLDGRNFSAIGEVAGGDNGVLTQQYQLTDANYATGSVAYYRIRQIDIDRTSTFSKVVYVNTSKSTGAVKIFPNPFVNEIQLTGISAADINKGSVKIFNVAGMQVNYEISGSNAIRINDAPAGVYILSVNGKSFKLIKQ